MSHVQLSMNQHVLNVKVSVQLGLDGVTQADIVMLKPLLICQLHGQAAVGWVSKPCKGLMDSTLCQAGTIQGTVSTIAASHHKLMAACIAVTDSTGTETYPTLRDS